MNPTTEQLINAVVNEDLHAIKKLVKKGVVITSDALQEAILSNNYKIAKYLIKNNPVITTELLTDAVYSRNGKMVKLLLSARINPNERFDGYLPIETAVKNKQWQIVKILLPKTDYTKIAETFRDQIEERSQRYRGTMDTVDQFKKQVDMSATDLLNYSDTEIKNLASFVGITKFESKEQLTKDIAEKLVYVNSNTIPNDTNAKCTKYRRKLTLEQITAIREKIYQQFIKFKDSVTEMSGDNLRGMFIMYDDLCFDGDIRKFMTNAGYTLQFRTSGEETFTTEGICTMGTCKYFVTIPVAYFKDVDGPTNVAGQMCNDQLDCLLRVIEHELVHLLIFMFCSDTFITDQHGPLFMNMVKNLFHHTDYRHYIF